MKRLTSIFLVLAMLLTLAPMNIFAAESDKTAFSDMKSTDYYAKAATALEELGIISGYPDGTYGAEKSITRAEMAAIVCRIIDKEAEAEKAKGETIFDDVASDYWASGYINIAVKEGIINGDGNGKFRPEDEVKYEEAIKMIVCALGYAKGIAVDPSDWSKAYLDIASQKGITADLKGKKGEAATRGDIAVMSYNGLATESENSKIPATPQASLKAGEYSGTQKVKLTTATKDADIYYTTDGTTPTAKSTKYTKEISVSKTSTIKAVAIKSGVVSKDILSVEYTIKRSSGGGGGGSGSSSPAKPSTPIAYTLSFAAATNGTIDTSVAGSYVENREIILTATPNENCAFVKWQSNNGGVFADANSATTIFTMPANDVEISAVFAKDFDNLLNPNEEMSGEITRQVWVKRIVDAVGLTMFNTSINSSYNDVDDDNNYLSAIEIALQNQVIPYSSESPSFYPEKYATTAFAVATTIKALGYEYKNTSECFDIAKECGIFAGASVNNNLTGTQADEIINKVREILNSTEIDLSAVPKAELAEETVVLEEEELGNIGYTYRPMVNMLAEDGAEIEAQITIGKTDTTEALKTGDCILLPPTEEFPGGLAQKIVSLDDTETNCIVLDTATPTLEEFMGDGEISAQGIQEIDETKFIFNEELADEFDVVYENDEINLMAGPSINIGDKPKITIKSDSIAVEFSKEVFDSVDANGSVEVFLPSIEYKVDLDWVFGVPVGVKELYFALNNKVEAEGNIEVTGRKNDIVNGLEIGRIPIPLGASGFTVDVVLWVGVSAKGKIQLEYSLETTTGVQYTNGRLRTINKCDSNLDFTPLECELEMGPNLSAMLTLYSVFDLADITASAGIGVNASTTVRDLDNICVDGTGYVYLEFSALKNSLIGELTHINGSWDVWNKDNSIFKKSLHFEGTPEYVGFVPTCTFGEGGFYGVVKDSETNQPIQNYEIKCYKISDGLGFEISAVISPNGQFVVDNMPSGSYKVEIIAEGYKKYEKTINIRANQSEDIGNVLMISETTEKGTGSGFVTDALTGAAVEGALVELYNSGDTNGDPIASITTNSSGAYSFEQTAGHYTIVISKEGYTEGVGDFVITASGMANQNITLIPLGTEDATEETISEIGDLRIVINWGEYPWDLDSHLCGPNKSGSGRFHIAYYDRYYYENGNLHAFLDHDDTDSYGPETTTVYDINTSGKYSFYIHDFTNKDSSYSTEMSNSGATVKVYVKESTGTNSPDGEPLYRAKMIGCFYVPVSTGGTLWHVFDYNAATGEVIRKDTMTYQSVPDNVGNVNLFGVSNFDEDEAEDIEKILLNLPEKE